MSLIKDDTIIDKIKNKVMIYKGRKFVLAELPRPGFKVVKLRALENGKTFLKGDILVVWRCYLCKLPGDDRWRHDFDTGKISCYAHKISFVVKL